MYLVHAGVHVAFRLQRQALYDEFYAESAIHALTQKTESMARRAEGLTKCKNEFADLARCL